MFYYVWCLAWLLVHLLFTRDIYPYTAPARSDGTHSDRFTSIRQVMCREGLSGWCYWEVIQSGCTCSEAVSYKDISRSFSDSEFGNNNKSWSLDCSQQGYSFRHNKGSKTVSGPRSSKIGVYLDYRAGTLSFYSISDTMTLLHKENTTFTQPWGEGWWISVKQ